MFDPAPIFGPLQMVIRPRGGSVGIRFIERYAGLALGSRTRTLLPHAAGHSISGAETEAGVSEVVSGCFVVTVF